MYLIAKDGVYIPTVPRPIDGSANLISGGRADIMVSCPEPNQSYELLDDDGNVIASIETDTSNLGVAVDLPTWTAEYPAYLQDLRAAIVKPNCSCPTTVDNNAMNGYSFEFDHTLHYYQKGEVIEREIEAQNHPYHQHVYPFQLIDGFGVDTSDPNAYYQLGDWHDSMDGTGVIRHRPDVFDGKIMIHCHRLDHEDRGMMGFEYNATTCQCGDVLADNELPTWAVIVIATVGALVAVAVIVALSVWCCRKLHVKKRTAKYKPKEEDPETGRTSGPATFVGQDVGQSTKVEP